MNEILDLSIIIGLAYNWNDSELGWDYHVSVNLSFFENFGSAKISENFSGLFFYGNKK